MPRAARIVLPGIPHHVVQRGNRRQRLFFDDGDRRAYLKLLAAALERHGTSCLGWCLMDNHVHLILLPVSADGLRAPLASAHTAYAQRINRARELSGHLFQGRFASYFMDDAHLMVAARYVENNPVAAGAVERPEDWTWSSARAHVEGRGDGLTDVAALGRHVPDWRAMLARGLEAGDEAERVERALRTGQPLGSMGWRRALAETHGVAIDSPARGRPRRPRPIEKTGTVPIFDK
ncbi:MAG TPA: transposase [Allosphingosinicella sp.]|jgi:putative transposase|nr:transposase [Allosphingosinicella sp.]